MELRPELCPPAVPTERSAQLRAAIDNIARLLEDGTPADGAIAAFNADTGHSYAAEHFLTYWESRNLEDFVFEAARPALPKVPDITRDELVEIVRRILDAEADADYYVLLLKTNVQHPRVEDLIFWPPPELVDAPPERIIDAALSYRPVAL
ncbi:bacteriocin immunity protein [Asanoa sp. NPDC049573]|uniref:bacteriocin immunity protein n=1 Tax=Asanoa sp. NPDC049573 TaxID=3155396 RepID=UPI0034310066